VVGNRNNPIWDEPDPEQPLDFERRDEDSNIADHEYITTPPTVMCKIGLFAAGFVLGMEAVRMLLNE